MQDGQMKEMLKKINLRLIIIQDKAKNAYRKLHAMSFGLCRLQRQMARH